MNNPNSQASKTQLRRSLLSTRRSLTETEWQEKSQQICEHLKTSSPLTQAKTVLAYFSVRQEPDLSALFSLPYRWGFPRCVDRDLVWHYWLPEEGLQRGAFNIPEPHPDAAIVDPESVDLILVPAVACDRQGYRLGYGGGFYDRLLSSPVWSQKSTVGVVFEFARLAELPRDPWDRSLQAVCTECGFFPAQRTEIQKSP